MTAAAMVRDAFPGATEVKKDVVLIDLSAIFHRNYHATANESVSGAYDASLAKIRKLSGGYGEKLVAICCDGRGNWRKELYPAYKAHREKLPAAFYGEFDRLKAKLRADGMLLWTCDGFEADDVIATAVDAAVTAGHAVQVVTHDKDLNQLLSSNVSVYNLNTDDVFTSVALAAKFGVTPNRFADWLALVGDKSDNVPGAPGIGPVEATKVLVAYGNLPGVFDGLAKLEKRGTKQQAILDNRAQIELSRKLVALSFDAPIKFDEIYDERKPMPEPQTIDTVEIPPLPAGNTATFLNPPTTAPETALFPSTLPFELQLQPRDPTGLLTLADVLFKSGLYPWLRNKESVAAVVGRGRELGLPAGAALEIFRPVEGRLTPIWQFIADKAEKDPQCEYFYCAESTDRSCTYVTKHRRNPVEQKLTYTIEQAARAGYVKPNSAWTKNPENQLRARCAVFAARMVYPGSTHGMYSTDEMEDSR